MSYCSHTQYPVGQGGLHLGIIGDVAYIYDCGYYRGSKVDWNEVKQDVIAQIQKCSTLHIFISHFHTDHYNKLIDLLESIPQDKTNPLRIITHYPKTTSVEKVVLLASYVSTENTDYYNEYYNLVVNNRHAKDDRLQVVLEDRSKTRRINIGDSNILFPYVTGFSTEEEKSIKHFLGVGSIEETLKHMESCDFALNICNKLKDLFKEQKHITNKIMLCLYCGSKTIDHLPMCCPCLIGQIPYCRYKWTNWLHTGDAFMDSDEALDGFVKHYGILLQNVQILQIPHHGSAASHDKSFLSIFYPERHSMFLYYTWHKGGNAKPKITDIMCNAHNIHLVSDNPNTKIKI